MEFDDAYQQSGLKAALAAPSDLSPQGRPDLTIAAADLAIAVAKLESISPALIAFTHMAEHSFEIAPSLPNVNGKPSSPWNFDVGPLQLSVQWIMRSVWQGDLSTRELPFASVFGSSFYEIDGITPCAFSGDPIANGRMAARRLFAVKVAGLSEPDAERVRAVKFTGPLHQEKRGLLFDALMSAFTKFFELYPTNLKGN
jgi:hypothetical protein